MPRTQVRGIFVCAVREPSHAELHTLLGNAGVQEAFILVGHSFGGLYTRVYASRFRTQVQGMVLIDASHPDQWTRTPGRIGWPVIE